jgi:hypothetical protein
VLDIDGSNLKALYRRAQAHLGSLDFAEAELDIRRGLAEVRAPAAELTLSSSHLRMCLYPSLCCLFVPCLPAWPTHPTPQHTPACLQDPAGTDFKLLLKKLKQLQATAGKKEVSLFRWVLAWP